MSSENQRKDKDIETQAEEEGFPLDAVYPDESELAPEDQIDESEYDVGLDQEES